MHEVSDGGVRWLLGNIEENKIEEFSVYRKGDKVAEVVKRYKFVTWYCDIDDGLDPQIKYRQPMKQIVIEDQDREWKLIWPGKMPKPIKTIAQIVGGAPQHDNEEIAIMCEEEWIEDEGWELVHRETSILDKGNLVAVGGFNESGEYAGIKQKGPEGADVGR